MVLVLLVVVEGVRRMPFLRGAGAVAVAVAVAVAAEERDENEVDVDGGGYVVLGAVAEV